MEIKSGRATVKAVLAALVFASMIAGYRLLVFTHAPDVFRADHEDMSFGWYVPIFSLYVLWRERREIARLAGEASPGGLLASIPFLLAGFLGARGSQIRLEILGFAGLAVCVTWTFYGLAAARKTLFPAAFLLFCMPLATFLDVVTVHLRLLASSTAFAILNGFGAEMVRRGTMVGAADGSFAIDVAEPCSGLRSLFALAALTAGYAYFTQPTFLRRAALFAAAVPIAVAANVARILSICLVANFASKDFATGFYHDYSGFVVFAAATVMMVAAGECVSRVAAAAAKRRGNAEKAVQTGDSPAPAANAPSGGRRIVLASFAAVFFIAAMLWQSSAPEVRLCSAPQVPLGELPGWESETLEPGQAEKEMLPGDTSIQKRRYFKPSGEWFVCTVIIGGASKSSIHRPELCLPAQGWRMSDLETRTFGGTVWRTIAVESAGSPPSGFMYTFFNQAGYRTASHTARIWRDVIDRSFLGRIDRWVMVTVHAQDRSDKTLSEISDLLEKEGTVLK